MISLVNHVRQRLGPLETLNLSRSLWDVTVISWREFLDQRGIIYSNPVFVDEPGFDNADEMEHVPTVVTVPAAGNLPFGWFFTGTEVSASVTMRKEFKNPD